MFQIGLEPGGGGLLVDVRGADRELLHRQPRRLPHRHQHRHHHQHPGGAHGTVPGPVRPRGEPGRTPTAEGDKIIDVDCRYHQDLLDNPTTNKLFLEFKSQSTSAIGSDNWEE